MHVLALLDVGPTEALLIAALFLLLFGPQHVPDIARQLGRLSAQFKSMSQQVQDEIDRERGLVGPPGDAVPLDQKRQLEQAEARVLAELQQAARALGIPIDGKDEAALRAEIERRVRA